MIAAAPLVAIAATITGRTETAIVCNRDDGFKRDKNGYVLRAYVDWNTSSGSEDATIHLPASTCGRLNRLLLVRDTRARPLAGHMIASPNGPAVDIADGEAVHDLLHEALHVRANSADEARVECLASRNKWLIVRLFGLAAWKAREVIRGMDIAHEATPPSYLADC